ncbi:GntR family transcriptional regulator [Bacillus piscicola]|uniref:GntR family transcriptional regulator n=1 Tax=Bacillus piscicola TaxID=1632684 RepID=UPI001F093EA6|nr:GntR family transcriptional regulator [Bacillus piscicola]
MTHIVKADPLHLQAYQLIKQLILEKEFEPGERVVELRLAKKLGISRGPVREALRMLIQDGLLESDNTVYKPSRTDIIDVFKCREILEILGVELAIQVMSDEQIAVTTDIIKETFKQGNVYKLAQLDQNFHDSIIECTKNKQLIQLMGLIKTKVMYMRSAISHEAVYPPFMEQHVHIVNALQAREVEKACEEMRNHIQCGLYHILDNVGE